MGRATITSLGGALTIYYYYGVLTGGDKTNGIF